MSAELWTVMLLQLAILVLTVLYGFIIANALEQWRKRKLRRAAEERERAAQAERNYRDQLWYDNLFEGDEVEYLGHKFNVRLYQSYKLWATLVCTVLPRLRVSILRSKGVAHGNGLVASVRIDVVRRLRPVRPVPASVLPPYPFTVASQTALDVVSPLLVRSLKYSFP